MNNKNNRVMKRIYLILGVVLFGFITPVNAQSQTERVKEYKTMKKLTESELNQKATKSARTEAKKLKKEGWLTSPGALPIEKQLDRSYRMQMEIDDDFVPVYMMGEGMSTGENYDAAKMQAIELAKQQIASQIQTELTALVESNVANNQLSAGEAASVTKSITAAKSLISQGLGRMMPVVEVYRTLNNKNKEVLVRLAYSSSKAREMKNKLDELLGW